MVGLHNLIIETFKDNHEVKSGHNPNVVFLVGFTDGHQQELLKEVESVLSDLPVDRMIKIVNAEGLSYAQLKTSISDFPDYDALEGFLYNNDCIIVITGISRLKDSDKGITVRELIKTLDDAHLKDIHPKADLIFIDYPSFLEKSWSQIGDYVNCNVFLS